MKIFKEFVSSVVFLILITSMGSATLWAQTGAALSSPQWLRGEGESLEIRIRGKLLRDDERPIENASMDVVMTGINHSEISKTIQPNLDGASYEVWLPVGAMKCGQVTLSVTATGVGTQARLFRNQIRQIAIDGFDIKLKPLRTINVTAVDLNGIAVADATVLVKVLHGGTVGGKTDATGLATLDLPEDAKISNLKAWKEDATVRLLGGRYPGVERNPLGDKHKIKMFPCETRKVIVLDENERPAAHVPLRFVFVLPEPNRAVLTTPDDVKMQTDDNGELALKWLPAVDSVLASLYSLDEQWAIKYDRDMDMKADVLTFWAADRQLKKISGRISSRNQGKSGLGGFAIEWFGPDVLENSYKSHSGVAFTDAKGDFSVDVIPGTKYGYWVDDETWTSATQEGILAHTNSNQNQSVRLTIAHGHPVRVSLLNASDKMPLAGARVDLETPYSGIRWNKGIGSAFGSGRRLRRTTDRSGVIEAVVAPGKLVLQASLGDWRLGKSVEVIPGKLNEFTIQKETVSAKITGQLKTWDSCEIDFQTCQIKVEGLDDTSSERLTLTPDDNGMFKFEMEAKTIGMLIYSGDRALAGSAFARSPKKPLELELYPTHDYTGQIVDATGEPIADHRVTARIKVTDGVGDDNSSNAMYKFVNSKTNVDGNFTFENLPSKTNIEIETVQHKEVSKVPTTLDSLVFQPDDSPRPSKVTKFYPLDENFLNEIAQRYKRIRRDCQLAGYHLLVTVSDTSDLELQRMLEKSINAAIGDLEQGPNIDGIKIGWMQMSVETAELNRAINRKLAKFKKWDAPAGSALVCVYNARGKLLERKMLASTTPDLADSIENLINNNAPTKPDAVEKWKTAFKTASQDNRRVLVLLGNPKQKSSRQLRRWIAHHEETLEKDFVLLSIDSSFDLRVDEALAAVRDLELVSPAIAILDADQRVVTHRSKFPARQAAIQQVLELGCQNIKGDEIKRIFSQSAATGGQ